MFDGERIVMDRERLTRDVKFLLGNGVLPISRVHFDIPLIHRSTSKHDIHNLGERIFEDLLEHVDIRIDHELRFPYRAQWQTSDMKTTFTAMDDLCENLHTQMKAYDVSREMFAFRADIFGTWLPMSRARRRILVADISSGITTRLGDGQRHHDGHQWTFSQMKGMRTHTGHLYVRGIAS